MYNLLQCSKNYLKTTGKFWNYYKDEPSSGTGGANNNINYLTMDLKAFDYKTRITGKLEGNNIEKEIKIVVPLKHLSNFWRTLEIPLINCEINLLLTWSENCVLTSKAVTDADPDANKAVAVIGNLTNATFKIADTNLYAPVVTLSNENDKKLLEQLRTVFKRTINEINIGQKRLIRLNITT